ncbi:MAG TPA: hypothetical protein VK174_16310 [Chitinophagales bacterium]|nr:hypothetical protein [Chitinophagales bacterium]
MKKLSFLFVLCWLASCTSPQKMLCRTWKVDEVYFGENNSGMAPAMQEAIANSLKSTVTFTFMPDSSYKIVSKGEVTTSKWWFSKDKKTIFAVDPSGQTVESKIEGLKARYFKINFPANNGRPGYVLTCSPVVN